MIREFIKYLEGCGGCTGKRNYKTCKYALICAITETLSKKGMVRNTEELILRCDHNNSSYINFDVLEECTSPDNADQSAGIGPCSYE